MDKKEELKKAVLYVSIWWLIVMTCGLLGDIFPSHYRTQPQYDVWEEQNWIIHIYSNTIYYYDIQEDKNANKMFYIEAGEEHCGYCYIETNLMMLDDSALNYSERYREMFDVLFDYYQRKELQMVEISDNL